MPKLKTNNPEKYINGIKVDKENDEVIYSDVTHSYIDKKNSQKYTSVTQLIGNYKQPFNDKFWSAYKACEALLPPEDFYSLKQILLKTKVWDSKYLEAYEIDAKAFEDKRAEILQSYQTNKEIACERGTSIHEVQENLFYNNDSKIKKYVGGGKFDVKKGYYKLDLERAVYPEFLISYDFDDYLKVAGQIDLIIKDGNDITIIDWKGLPLDTPIATKEGWKTIGELTLNDVIFDKNGELTKINHISEVHYNPCYKITFDNGETIVADHEHKWVISFKKQDGTFRETVMTTEEIAAWLEVKPRTSTNIPKILNAKALQLPEVDLPIDPYVFGAWLGDGSKSCGIITNMRAEFWEEIKKRGYTFGENLSAEGDAEMRTIYNIRGELSKLNVLNNKHIPNIYLRSSYKQRLDLLRGLMDTDGYYHTKRNRFVMGTNQKWQAEQTAELVASLGGKPTIFNVEKTCNGKRFKSWDVCWTTTDFNPFLIRNKEAVVIKKDNNSFRNIISVEPVNTVPTKCLGVESDTHTYLVGKLLIPTHNTNKKIDQESYFDRNTKQRQMMKFPLNNIQDCNFYHYTLQLSLYAYLLEKINPKFKIKKLIIVHFDHDGNETEYTCDYLKDDVTRMLLHYRREQKIKNELSLDKTIVF